MKSTISKEIAEKLFNEFSDYVFRIALLLTGSKDAADDVTQETFIRVFGKYHTYDASKPIEPWIYKIALNVSRNMYRKQKRLILTDEQPESNSKEVVEDIVLEREKNETLRGEINKLGFKSREIVILHFYMGLTLREISQILRIPEGTCKSRLNLALKALRANYPLIDPDITGKGGELYETI